MTGFASSAAWPANFVKNKDPTPPLSRARIGPGSGPPAPGPLEPGFACCPVYSRYALTRRAELPGPAVVEERESTTVVGPDARLAVDAHLNLVIDVA